MKVRVSGVTYSGALDPLATDVPKEQGWPEPVRSRAGRGFRFTYEVDERQAWEIAAHLESLAEGFSYSDDASARAEARAFAKDAARLRAEIG